MPVAALHGYYWRQKSQARTSNITATSSLTGSGHKTETTPVPAPGGTLLPLTPKIRRAGSGRIAARATCTATGTAHRAGVSSLTASSALGSQGHANKSARFVTFASSALRANGTGDHSNYLRQRQEEELLLVGAL